MKILIANPNMNCTMTELMVHEAETTCRPDTTITGISAEFGVPYIESRSEMAIAGYALLDSLAHHHRGHDAVIVGAFCHSIVAAAKELLPIPVVGIAEASMRAAQLLGRRVSIIGIGSRARGANDEIVTELGMTKDVVSIRLLPLSGIDLAKNQADADAQVIKLGKAAVDDDNADVLVLGGAAFSGIAERVAPQLPVPVISPITFAVGIAELTVISGWRKPSVGTFSKTDKKTIKGLTKNLTRFFQS